MYLEQLISYDNSVLLNWKHISSRLQYLPKGHKPLWFTILENTIITNHQFRLVNSQLQLPPTNSISFTTGHYKQTPKPWIIAYNHNCNNIIIGKARKYDQTEDTISITHWTIDFDTSHTELYPSVNYTCMQCTGCHLNSNHIQNKCIFNISPNLTTKFLGRKINSNSLNKLNLHANLLDLLYSIALRNPVTIPSQPNIIIYNNAVFDIFTQNQAAQILQQIAQSNSSSSQFTFYTDGSVNNITNNRCKMGIG